MKIILSVNSIRTPLTGIGKYSWELASRLPQFHQVAAVKYIARGQWLGLPTLQRIVSQDNVSGNNLRANRLGRKLFNNALLRSCYQLAEEKLQQFRLKNIKDFLYHGPNYSIPQTHLKSVVTVHDLSTLKDPKWHPVLRRTTLNKALPTVLSNANLVLTDSQAIKNEIHDYFQLPPEKVIAIPLGVDQRFRRRTLQEMAPTLKKYGLKAHCYTLCVATIEPRKNINRLIRAYSRLPNSLKTRWPLVLIGEPGWCSDDTHDLINSLKGQGWLNYMGFVPAQDLPILYSGARLFAYPSLYEGFGLPIAEAMASGIATLTSNVSAMPEVANGAAQLINPEDDDDLEQSLIHCLQDESWQSNSIAKGLLQAQQLTWEQCVERTVAAYRLVLDSCY